MASRQRAPNAKQRSVDAEAKFESKPVWSASLEALASSRSTNDALSRDTVNELQRLGGNRATRYAIQAAGSHLEKKTDGPEVDSDAQASVPKPGVRVQRREIDDVGDRPAQDESRIAADAALPENWTRSDREGWTQRWRAACLHNLENVNSGEYTDITERADFYKWFYEETAKRGYHTRWALAAYIVASGMAGIAGANWTEWATPFTNELQGLARLGNQIIFDDALPKLKRLWDNGPATGQTAIDIDAQILAEEQALVQAMYNSMSSDATDRFGGIAAMGYWRVGIGQWLGLGGSVDAGPFHVEGDTPAFRGNFTSVEDRWNYGMMLAQRFSKIPVSGKPGDMPDPGPAYTSGALYASLNVREHLHMIDAMLNDADIPEKNLVEHLEMLSDAEQLELMTDPWRVQRMVSALSYAEMKNGIEHLGSLPLVQKFVLLERSLVAGWHSVSYSDVQTMITSASAPDRSALHGARWQSVFEAICDDNTIMDAVRDLGLDEATANRWISSERSLI